SLTSSSTTRPQITSTIRSTRCLRRISQRTRPNSLKEYGTALKDFEAAHGHGRGDGNRAQADQVCDDVLRGLRRGPRHIQVRQTYPNSTDLPDHRLDSAGDYHRGLLRLEGMDAEAAEPAVWWRNLPT